MSADRSRAVGQRNPWRATLAFLVLVALAVTGPVWGAQGEPLIGLDGQQLNSRELERGLVILVFWTTWSPRGRDIVPRVNALVRGWGDRATVVTVNFQEDPAKVRLFLASKEELNAPVFLDERGDFSKRHRVSSAPWLLVLKDGARVFSGKLSRDPNQVIEQASQ